jgi:hypothetical protein
MRTARPVLFGAVALSLAAISAPAAQQPDRSRKPPRQTHDKGLDDAPSVAVTRLGERNVTGVQVLLRQDGTLVAELDESFHDAVVATKNADGTISYTCLHGLPAAAGHVATHAPGTPAPTTAPVLEEK